ncbi:hypothetical protein NUU61_000683 [Penicillium alfredii]|uniref:Uncharacterized protein n=1 Tax=Penicillium alfredii TaxID=1506179 RepID=A0A9W9GA23_9EURO|nr:uncharacterized protein NUU61_000683 [Penicillium alfredii]KAJ5114924.1 hypothetical protein NUU61_000683 [Penicillium alfredii]
MQVAEILSDITSLRVCGHNEALALVNTHNTVSGLERRTSGETSTATTNDGDQLTKDEDLRRAKELVELHYEVKARHANGMVDDALSRARDDVQRVLKELQ